MKFFDRLLTIVITATLTSAVWIVFGTAIIDAAEGDEEQEEAAPSAPAEPVEREPRSSADNAPTTGSAPPPQDAEQTAASSALPKAPPVAAAKTALAMPVAGVLPKDLADSFFEPRGAGGLLRHEAIDIMAPKGTPVTAAAAGRIAKIHRSDAGGKSIYVRSNDKATLYFYAHLDAYADDLKEGAKVDQGAALGTVGTTGNAFPAAPHLHFAVFQTTKDAQWWEPATAINPYPLLTEPVG
ncbi:MAG: peptidoglycan DD-metalloendopeptidase family protein [Pseudomonadota bacterium]